MHSDQIYIEAILQNNPTLLSEIYNQHARKVESWICANSGSVPDARDMMQEALITIARQARRPQGLTLTCPFLNYLMMVVRSKWFNELKKRKRQQVTIDESVGFTDEYDIMELAEAAAIEDSKISLFKSFFSKLPEGCQNLIRLSWTGISMQEVAEKLNVSYAYARKRKSQCVAKLMATVHASPEFKTLKTNF